ncbi:MAG: hypothetical protein HY314_06055 [Acidobacteria bacterium]|nr:hypothetical protein [Acidobacteriota bacterium]
MATISEGWLFDVHQADDRIALWIYTSDGHLLQLEDDFSPTIYIYGRVLYKGPSYPLFGRWHIDRKNSFIFAETGLEGLAELARLSKIPMQRLARTSPGSAMSSMQLDRAVQESILIPWRKSEPEAFKSAWDLLVADKGGLVFQPPVGAFEQVAEIDYSQMYPTIMVAHNISPETVLCRCCDNRIVPEAGYTICEKREGLVPQTLRPILAKRKKYKRLMKAIDGQERDRYDARQTAIKWCLVSCLDGGTLILCCHRGRWRVAPIREIVGSYFSAAQWGMRPVEELAVPGIGADLRNTMKPVTHVIKVPAPPQMIRVKLRWGRSLLLTPDHLCYVLQDGRLQVKRADQLAAGDWIPMAATLEGVAGEPRRGRWLGRLPERECRVPSSLNFTRVRSVETVFSADQFVYCFKLADEPPAFFIEGGVLTHNCFGYLGYRNARFGRIEAHEAVTAFGREKLLQAKEIAEASGYRVLHALTDSLWILDRPEGALDLSLREAQLLELCRRISEATDVEMSLEGIYDWFVFLPSKVKLDRPVPGRYFGQFTTGELKARGLAFRRHDLPPFIREAQLEMLAVLSTARSLRECAERLPAIIEIFRDYALRLKEGQVDSEKLLITRRLTKDPSGYKVENLTALAAQQLQQAGAKLHAGEMVRYVIQDADALDKRQKVIAEPFLDSCGRGYDATKYLELLTEATEEVLAMIPKEAAIALNSFS